jgi:ribosomal protein S18 acetylase RimI-like enzyme
MSDLPNIIGLLSDDVIEENQRVRHVLESHEEAWRSLLRSPENVPLTAWNEQELVGYVQLTIIPILGRGGGIRAQLEDLRVLTECRRSGIGRKLIARAKELAVQKGATAVQLTVDSRRSAAMLFYEALGFKPTHVGFKLTLKTKLSIDDAT